MSGQMGQGVAGMKGGAAQGRQVLQGAEKVAWGGLLLDLMDSISSQQY